MRRLLFAALIVSAVAFVSPAVADDALKGGGTVQMLIAKVEGDKLVTSTSSQQQRSVTVNEKDGPKTITISETITTSIARDLKYLKATGTDDKEVPAAEFKDRLKDGGLVVFLNAPLDATWKAKFKKGTLFVEYTSPKEEKKDEKKDGDK